MVKVDDSLLYTDTHEWIRVDGDTAVIGITDYAQEQLGDIVYVELPEVGENIFKGQAFGSIESVKTVSELFAPLTGNVTERNEELFSTPELINKEPYRKGWMIKIKLEDKKQMEDLLSPGNYEDLIISESEEEE